MNLIDRAGPWLYPALLTALGLVLLAGGWTVARDPLIGITLMIPPLALATVVTLRRGSERINPPQDERQRFLERSVMATGFVGMFAVALALTVWELANALPVTELRATAVLLAGGLTAVVAQRVLHRRN